MTDPAGALPLVITLAAVALVVAVVVIGVRLHRRSARMRAAADAAASDAAEMLRRLDDAVDELDVAFEAADALDAPDAPTALRRARSAAHRVRDRGFSDVSDLADLSVIAALRRDRARRIGRALETQLSHVETTRAELAQWATTNRTLDRLRSSARDRRDSLLSTTGDPEPLLAALRLRFDPVDWSQAQDAASAAAEAIADADAALAGSPTPDALHTAAESLRRAERHLRAVEDAHRIALQAADNVDAEIAAAREELGAAIATATQRPADCSPSASEHLRAAAADLDAVADEAARRPRRAIAGVARIREIRDQALGEAVSPRVRLEAARAALPGTLACARAALAAADARDDDAPIDDRLRLEHARRELAAARASTDAAEALAHARAAWHAVPPPPS